MEGFNPPDTLSSESDNLNANWKRWKQDLNFYLAATEKKTQKETKLSQAYYYIV